MNLKKYTPYSSALFLFGFGLCLYWQVIFFGYVWDDSPLFLDKVALLNEPLTWALLSDPVLPGTSYFRPLVFLTFYVEFHVFGQNPLVSHAINFFLYLLNVVLLFGVAQKLAIRLGRSSWRTPLLAAFMYAAHPALVESTAWVSGRFDVLVTTFILLATLFFLSGLDGWRRSLLLALLILGALLSKELGVVTPAVLICLWVGFSARSQESPIETFSRGLRENAAWLIASLVVFLGYLWLRSLTPNGVYHERVDLDYFTLSWGALLPLEAFKYYLIQVFVPFSSVGPQHPIAELDPWSWRSVAGSLAALLFLMLWLLYAWRCRTPAAWFALAGLACLMPVLHLVPLTVGGNIGHERFMTTALAFFSLAVVFVRYDKLLVMFRLSVRAGVAIAVLVISSWSLLSIATVVSILPYWSSDLQLWGWAYRNHPKMEAARYNYLYGALLEGRLDLVEQEIQELQKTGGGLEVADQILYANMLLRKFDPDSLKYSQGVMYALPKFHEMPDGREKIDRFLLTATQMANAYADYAHGLLIFKGDAEGALKYNEIALWYLSSSEKLPLWYQNATIHYALGDYGQAEQVLIRQEGLYYYRKEEMKLMIRQSLSLFCKARGGDDENCKDLSRRALLDG